MGYRTTTQVRIKKATLDRLRSLSLEQREDMVDLLNFAVALLERELFKPEAAPVERITFPVSCKFQSLGGVERVSFPVAAVVTRQEFEVNNREVDHGG